MAVSREKESLARLFAHEGDYSNHPADPSGPTMKGVTHASMTDRAMCQFRDQYRARKDIEKSDMRLSPPTARKHLQATASTVRQGPPPKAPWPPWRANQGRAANRLP
ncbi:glycosyl hydrolase 108 family protein [Mesorhizobium loti]|uniref:glycosyl hydrolase 108 family protein n=1 Tax=Rhizobium loti TaxID=381 RepID=UPI0012694AE9|nr:glycosyl hydrolase 108 family protein [Mesorhizobium loti]